MYWQVYLHKTVLVAEKMLINITERVREIYNKNDRSLITGTSIDYFVSSFNGIMDEEALKKFIRLDDFDFMHAIKVWSQHDDKILSTLCNGILNRKLLKIKLQAEPFSDEFMQQKLNESCQMLGLGKGDGRYVAFAGEAVNTMYKTYNEHINILFKDGQVKDISQVDNALIHNSLSSTVKKFYICYYE
jgi:HD superfamily phosphohydrolase